MAQEILNIPRDTTLKDTNEKLQAIAEALASGGGTGAVQSVNGMTGVVELSAEDVDAVAVDGGDTSNTIVQFTEPKELKELESGEKHSVLFGKLKLAVKNVITLAKLMGTADISAIGGGTVTGAISSLNSNLMELQTGFKITKITSVNFGRASNSEPYIQLITSKTEFYQLTFKSDGIEFGHSNNGVWERVWYIIKNT